MEKHGFVRGINNPNLNLGIYKRMGMDGCCTIMKAAEGAGYRACGDGWHCTKCKSKHFCAHCDAHAPRQLAGATEQAGKSTPKPDRPDGPAAKVEKLGSVPAEQPPSTLADMRAQLLAAAEKLPEGSLLLTTYNLLLPTHYLLLTTHYLLLTTYYLLLTTESTDQAKAEAKVKKLHKALRQIAFATRRFSERGFTTPQRGGYGLQAYADALSSYFSIYSRQAVLVGDEVQQWEQFDSYSIKQLEADALCKKRTASNADLKVQRAAARQWEGFFRTVYNFVFVYTASLRKTDFLEPES